MKPATVALATQSSLSASFAAPGIWPLPQFAGVSQIPAAASVGERNIVVGVPPYLKIRLVAALELSCQPMSRNFLPAVGVQIVSGVPAVMAVEAMSLTMFGVRSRV